MKKMKLANEAQLVSVEDWIRRLGQETDSFEVTKVVEAASIRTDLRRLEWDYVITLSTKCGGHTFDVFVEMKPQLTPQTALAVFEKLKWVPPDGVLMVCSPFISPRVAELCREHNVCYLDYVGNCLVKAPGLFIQISGRPNQRNSTRAAVNPFSKKSSRIVRTLLTHPERGWQVQELAEEADVSIGLVSKVKKTLQEEAYLYEQDRLLFLRDPKKLLADWVSQYRPQVQGLPLFAMCRQSETEGRLAGWCKENGFRYALTQLSAAWRYSPMVRYEKTVAYVDKKIASKQLLNDLLEDLDARKVDSGVNLTLWLTDDPAVFSDDREIDAVRVVSPLQLYLDLKMLPGRGEEVAEEILEKELPALLVGQNGGGEKNE